MDPEPANQDWASWLSNRARDQVRQSLSVEIDAGRLVDVIEELRPRLELTARIRLSLTDLVVRAATLTALEHRALLFRPGVDEHAVHVGLVVANDTGHPQILLIEDAHQRTLMQLAGEREDMARNASQFDGDTANLLVSNLGPYGVDHFVPGAGPTPAPIIGVGRLRELGDRHALWLSCSVDARYVALVPAALALDRMRGLLERPTLLVV